MTNSQSDWERDLDASTEVDAGGEVRAPEARVPALTVLAHPNPFRVGDRVLLPALGSGRSVPLSRLTPLFAEPGAEKALPLADPFLSRTPIHLVPGNAPGSIRFVEPGGGCRVELFGARAPSAA
jgi:two-component system, NtrC family, nitrogen regulation response regulator GlnG